MGAMGVVDLSQNLRCQLQIRALKDMRQLVHIRRTKDCRGHKGPCPAPRQRHMHRIKTVIGQSAGAAAKE